jgi:hypothetical protein
VGAVGVEELGEFWEEVHELSSSVSTTDQPSFKRAGYEEDAVARLGAGLFPRTFEEACGAPFTLVQDDRYIWPVLKLLTQLLIAAQTGTGHYEDEHIYVPR